MRDDAGYAPPEYNLEDWERALTIHVGTAYACHGCGSLVMVTKGGVGVMDLVCCDREMEQVRAQTGEPEGQQE
ncbi:MAG: hypothetical protein AMK73_08835 [Planctomycetes bacterium SM23_32]|nr:MAG: hypothetical protein AMK73_08835 [Planctomycetes bacterium SM23_32]